MAKSLSITITQCTDCPYFGVDRATYRDEKDEWFCGHKEAYKAEYDDNSIRDQKIPIWCPLPDSVNWGEK